MSSNRLHGIKAFITAAANGIGREAALVFTREGAEVLATDIDFEGLSSLSRSAPGIETRVLDVTEPGATEGLLRNNRYDVIFNWLGSRRCHRRMR